MQTIDLKKWANLPDNWRVVKPCENHTTIIERGKWGPHRARLMCVDCNKHIKWVKTQQNPYEKRTGSKYQYGSNKTTT